VNWNKSSAESVSWISSLKGWKRENLHNNHWEGSRRAR
jgi:hypothetical protein